jgi:hypothetical protein
MKILPFVLLVALIGCSRSQPSALLTTDVLSQWVPVGTSLGSARQTMEHHQFACSVISYDKPEQMGGDREASIFGSLVVKDGVQQVVTNLSYLVCTQSNVEVRICLANGVTRGVSVSSKQ